MVIRCEYAEINGTQLAVMRTGQRQKCKMYALIQVFNAFQNGKKTTRIPRTTSTLHKRLKELQIETKLCNLRQKHRLKLLKAIPHRVANCCLISHNDLLKLCRSCGVKTKGLGKKMEDVKTHRKNKHKKQTKRVKRRGKKAQLECRNSDEFVLEISGESDENDGSENTQKQLTTQLPNTSNSDIFFACKKSAENVHVHNRVLHSRHSNNTRSTCKQTEDSSAEHANSGKSTTNSVSFSFSEPCLGFQACERKTVTFDIHSKAFSSTDGPLLDAARAKNMREVGFECGEKQGKNMDDHTNTNTCNPVDIGRACDLSCEPKTTPLKEKEYFGFTGQEKDDNSWQTFGDVPDQDGAAILEISNTDYTEENNDGEIRFVNGFQFAVAAQQIRVGGKDLESDSDRESELSNFEINSNLSDLSDLSVSSDSLNSVSSTDTSLGVVTRVRQRARVGSNSDGESECTSTNLRSPAKFIHDDHAKPCHNNTTRSAPNCGQTDSNNPPCVTNNLWSQHSARYVNKINNSLRLKNDKCSNVKALDKNCPRNYVQRKGRGDTESERSAERSHARNSGDVIAAAKGGHHDIESGAALVLRQCEQTNTLVSQDCEKDEISHGSTKLGQKRKSNQQRGELEESQIIPNGKRHKKKKKKKKKKDRDKFYDKSLESYDVNGNCTKTTPAGSCLRTEIRTEICPKRKENKGDPKKVAELKRKLEAISSELARLQKGKGKKSVGKGENTSSKKKRRLKPKETKRKTKMKRTKNGGLDLRTCTFKMSEFLFLPPSLVVREGDLRPTCSMAVPRGVLPPNNHPIWQWKIGGTPLPNKPTRHKVLQHGANLGR